MTTQIIKHSLSKENASNIIANQGKYLYTEPLKAVLQEYYSNAFDETVGTNNCIDITLPTELDPYLSIRDYGRGMSKEFVKKYYTTWYSSNKRKGSIGKFGNGSKCFPCYTDHIKFETYWEGIKYEYISIVSEEEQITCNLISSEEVNLNNEDTSNNSTEKNNQINTYSEKVNPGYKGTKVSIPIENDDFDFCLLYFLHIYFLTKVNLRIVNIEEIYKEPLDLNQIKLNLKPLYLDSKRLDITVFNKFNDISLVINGNTYSLEDIFSLKGIYKGSLINVKGIPYESGMNNKLLVDIGKSYSHRKTNILNQPFFYIYDFKDPNIKLELTPARDKIKNSWIDTFKIDDYGEGIFKDLLTSINKINVESVEHLLILSVFNLLANYLEFYSFTSFFKNQPIEFSALTNLMLFCWDGIESYAKIVYFNNDKINKAEKARLLKFLVKDIKKDNSRVSRYNHYFDIIENTKFSKELKNSMREIIFLVNHYKTLKNIQPNSGELIIIAEDVLETTEYKLYKRRLLDENKGKSSNSVKKSPNSKGFIYKAGYNQSGYLGLVKYNPTNTTLQLNTSNSSSSINPSPSPSSESNSSSNFSLPGSNSKFNSSDIEELNNKIILVKSRSNKTFSLNPKDKQFILESVKTLTNEYEIKNILRVISWNYKQFNYSNEIIIEKFNKAFTVIPEKEFNKVSLQKELEKELIKNKVPNLKTLLNAIKVIRTIQKIDINDIAFQLKEGIEKLFLTKKDRQTFRINNQLLEEIEKAKIFIIRNSPILNLWTKLLRLRLSDLFNIKDEFTILKAFIEESYKFDNLDTQIETLKTLIKNGIIFIDNLELPVIERDNSIDSRTEIFEFFSWPLINLLSYTEQKEILEVYKEFLMNCYKLNNERDKLIFKFINLEEEIKEEIEEEIVSPRLGDEWKIQQEQLKLKQEQGQEQLKQDAIKENLNDKTLSQNLDFFSLDPQINPAINPWLIQERLKLLENKARKEKLIKEEQERKDKKIAEEKRDREKARNNNLLKSLVNYSEFI